MMRRLANTMIRGGEIFLNLMVKGCCEGLRQLYRAKVELSIPDLHRAIQNRDLKEIVTLAKNLAKAGHNPREISWIASRAGITGDEWDALLLAAHREELVPAALVNVAQPNKLTN